MNKKLNELNIVEAINGLERKEFTSVDLTKACLNEIKLRNAEINAFITVTEVLALEQAKESDLRRVKGEVLSQIDGIPCAIKDNMNITGVKTTAGSKMLENFEAVDDSFVIKKLKEAGAVFLGKTNMDEFAMGSSTETSYFGITKNPVDESRVPGGSSGGSAAAVAANMCIFALGSDTGGSIRQPASFCGVVGLKPTYGAVSRNGLLSMSSSLDQIGSFSKTVEDTEIILNIISGYDTGDSTSLKTFSKIEARGNIEGLKIAMINEGLSNEVQEEIKVVLNKIADVVGAEKVSIGSNVMHSLDAYYIIMPVEVSSNLGRYDGVKYGLSPANAKDLMEVYTKSRGEGFGQEVKKRIMLGAFASSEGYKDQYYGKALKVRSLIKKDLKELFKKYDLVVLPTTLTTAFKIGEKSKDPISMYLSDLFTVTANIAGIPAISIPVGKDNNGLPIGVQIMGPELSEEKILSLAKFIEENNG